MTVQESGDMKSFYLDLKFKDEQKCTVLHSSPNGKTETYDDSKDFPGGYIYNYMEGECVLELYAEKSNEGNWRFVASSKNLKSNEIQEDVREIYFKVTEKVSLCNFLELVYK